MTPQPPSPDHGVPIARSIAALAEAIGTPDFVAVCVGLLAGADRADHLDALRSLGGRADVARWDDHWVRTWGARGLLHVWDDSASSAIKAGLGDEHWRPAEMCLKVAAHHDVAATADGAARLAAHRLPRVRAQAARALGVVGDTEHVGTVRDLVDDEDPAVRRAAARALDRLALRLDVERDPDPDR